MEINQIEKPQLLTFVKKKNSTKVLLIKESKSKNKNIEENFSITKMSVTQVQDEPLLQQDNDDEHWMNDDDDLFQDYGNSQSQIINNF